MASGDRPSPRGARSLDELAERLQLLRGWAGNPSYAELARRVNRARGAGPGSHPTSKVTVYDCFRTGRVRLDIELVADLVRALGAADDASAWRTAYAVIEQGTGAEAVAEVRATIDQPVAGLVGRDRELAEILASPDEVTCLVGMAGVGKTQLALAAAQRLAPRYERHWQALLRGFDPDLPPASPAAVIGGLLAAAGVASSRRLGLPEQAAALRQELAGTPTLVVLDNARDAAQLAPIVAALRGARVLVTSRSHLVGASVAGLEVVVQPLAAEDSLRLLGGYDRDLSRPEHREEALQIAEWCGHLPLQLAIAGARVAERPGWAVSDHRARLESLPVDGQVLGAMETSFAALTDDVRRALRMAALHPGGEMSVAAAAALAGLPESGFPETQLLAASLVLPVETGGVRLHDLVRQHALAEGADLDAASQREAAFDRLGAYYLALAEDSIPRVYGPHRVTPEETRQAHRRLSAETAPALAAAFALLEQGRLAQVGELAMALYPRLAGEGRWAEAEALLRAAAGDPDPSRSSRAMTQLSRMMMLTGRMDEAPAWVTRAIERDPDNWLAFNQLGSLQAHTARLTDCYDTYLRASRLAAAAGDEAWLGRIEGNLGFAALGIGDHELAHEHVSRAVEIGLKHGDRHSLFFIHMNLLHDAVQRSCWPEFEAHRGQVESEAAVVAGRSEQATLRLDRARWHLEGRRQPTEALAEIALDVDPLADLPFHLTQAHLLRTQAFLALNDVAQAEQEMATAEAICPTVESRELDLSLLVARGELELARGDLSEARATLTEARETSEELAWIERRRAALDGLVRVAEAAGDPAAAEDHRKRLGSLRNPHGCLLRRDPSLMRGLPDDQSRETTTR